jgi:hypothetical protein
MHPLNLKKPRLVWGFLFLTPSLSLNNV